MEKINVKYIPFIFVLSCYLASALFDATFSIVENILTYVHRDDPISWLGQFINMQIFIRFGSLVIFYTLFVIRAIKILRHYSLMVKIMTYILLLIACYYSGTVDIVFRYSQNWSMFRMILPYLIVTIFNISIFFLMIRIIFFLPVFPAFEKNERILSDGTVLNNNL